MIKEFLCGVVAGVVGGIVENSAGEKAGKYAGEHTRDYLLEKICGLTPPEPAEEKSQKKTEAEHRFHETLAEELKRSGKWKRMFGG